MGDDAEDVQRELAEYAAGANPDRRAPANNPRPPKRRRRRHRAEEDEAEEADEDDGEDELGGDFLRVPSPMRVPGVVRVAAAAPVPGAPAQPAAPGAAPAAPAAPVQNIPLYSDDYGEFGQPSSDDDEAERQNRASDPDRPERQGRPQRVPPRVCFMCELGRTVQTPAVRMIRAELDEAALLGSRRSMADLASAVRRVYKEVSMPRVMAMDLDTESSMKLRAPWPREEVGRHYTQHKQSKYMVMRRQAADYDEMLDHGRNHVKVASGLHPRNVLAVQSIFRIRRDMIEDLQSLYVSELETIRAAMKRANKDERDRTIVTAPIQADETEARGAWD